MFNCFRHATTGKAWVRKKDKYVTASKASTLELEDLGRGGRVPWALPSGSRVGVEGAKPLGNFTLFWSLRYPRLSDFECILKTKYKEWGQYKCIAVGDVCKCSIRRALDQQILRQVQTPKLNEWTIIQVHVCKRFKFYNSFSWYRCYMLTLLLALTYIGGSQMRTSWPIWYNTTGTLT